jgi:hypothetical protein
LVIRAGMICSPSIGHIGVLPSVGSTTAPETPT